MVLVGQPGDRPSRLRADLARLRLVSRKYGIQGQRLPYPGEGILTAYFPPPDTGLAIIYVDNEIIVVDKPAGLLSVPGRGEGMGDCLASRVQARLSPMR